MDRKLSIVGERGAVAPAEPELATPVEILEPEGAGSPLVLSPLVLSSPHSGRVYPRDFLRLSRLDPAALRRSEDAFVDEMFAGAAAAPLVRALFPRAFLDVNREPYELDPRMFDGRLPAHANTRSLRVAGGLGTIARIVGESQEIYSRRLPVEAALARIESLYRPYHAALRRLIQRASARFGVAVLVDCHSMPSFLSAGGRTERVTADIVLGDRFGTSCDSAFAAAAESELRRRGYSVQRNKPYAGGFITEHYGAPAARVHALQIEVNRALYLDEARIEKTQHFERVAADMRAVVEALSRLALAGDDRRAAAE